MVLTRLELVLSSHRRPRPGRRCGGRQPGLCPEPGTKALTFCYNPLSNLNVCGGLSRVLLLLDSFLPTRLKRLHLSQQNLNICKKNSASQPPKKTLLGAPSVVPTVIPSVIPAIVPAVVPAVIPAVVPTRAPRRWSPRVQGVCFIWRQEAKGSEK